MIEKINQVIEFLGGKLYTVLTIISTVPIYFAINGYVSITGVGEVEAVSVAASLVFIPGVFIGRQIAIAWFARRKVSYTVLLILFAVITSACLIWLFFHVDHQQRNRPGLNLLLFWWPFVLMSFCIGAMITTAHSIIKAPIAAAQRQVAQSKTELHLLQSQLSPHFLFNTLNNLYGLSITRHEKVPPLILKLSELLRYSVYETRELYVPLKDELRYIANYIEFEKIRMEDRLELRTDFEPVDSDELLIAPMLLIVFIENAFKHSKNSVSEKVLIFIALKTWSDRILFTVKNSHGRTDAVTNTEKHSCLGLANVKKRLELLYPGKHELELVNENGWYSVHLQLNRR